MPDPRNNADDAYAAFMSMPDSEWAGLIKSLAGGGVLQPEEHKGFIRALNERSPLANGWSPGEPNTDIEPVIKTAIARINQDSIVWGDLLDLVAKPAPVATLPTTPPLPAQITDEQAKALERFPSVFGSVVPTEVRALQPSEVSLLLDERAVLKTIGDMVGKRVDDGIRSTILNHNDVEWRETHSEDTDVSLDKDGHVIVANKIKGEPTSGQVFAVETRKGSPRIDPKIIQALADDEGQTWIEHDDYLAMTRQERVFDEHRAMIHLRKKPELVRAIAEATVRGAPTVAVQPRKA